MDFKLLTHSPLVSSSLVTSDHHHPHQISFGGPSASSLPISFAVILPIGIDGGVSERTSKTEHKKTTKDASQGLGLHQAHKQECDPRLSFFLSCCGLCFAPKIPLPPIVQSAKEVMEEIIFFLGSRSCSYNGTPFASAQGSKKRAWSASIDTYFWVDWKAGASSIQNL